MFVLYVSAADAAVALVLVVVVVFGSKFRGKRRFFLLGGTTRGCVYGVHHLLPFSYVKPNRFPMPGGNGFFFARPCSCWSSVAGNN